MKKRTLFTTVLIVILIVCLTVPFHAGASSSIRILYKCNSTGISSIQIGPWLKVYNDGPDAISLSQITIKYWYTRDNFRDQVNVCDFAQVGAANVSSSCSAVSTLKTNADYFLQVGFTSGAGSLASGANSGEIQLRLNNDNYSNYNQANDYSFNASMTTYSQNTNITAYINGVLVFGTEPSTTNKGFLVVVSKPLYNTGSVSTALNTYMSDLIAAGWQPVMMKTDINGNSNPDIVCGTPAALKSQIQTLYNQGYVGFVLIGSESAIPTPFWRHSQDPSEAICPTDLYYADMDTWTDYNSDGVYDSYDSTDPETGNFLGANFAPEMFWGRISAGCITSSINDEATKVVSYLNKVHAYRTGGSNLTATQRERMLVFYDNNDYKGGREVIDGFQGLTTKITGLFDDSVTTRAKLKTELENGYQFAQYAIHSGPDSHGISEWTGDTQTGSNFDLSYLSTTTPRVHYINMFCCSACSFWDYSTGTEVANIGAAYIFNNDYILNISGSTGPWGFMPDAAYWNDINQDKTIGEAFKSYFRRMVNEYGETGCPKGVLLGDPTIVYNVAAVTNKMPYIRSTHLEGSTGQARLIAVAGQGLTIQATDPENDATTVTVTGLSGGTLTGTNQVTWTPGAGDVGSIFQSTVTASDRPANVYTEEFTVKVVSLTGNNLLLDNGFESLSNWSSVAWDGNCTMQLDSTVKRSGSYSGKIYSSVSNDCRFNQVVSLTANTYYQLSGYIRTSGVSGGLGATLSAEFSGEWPMSSTALIGDNSNWQFVTLVFYSGSHTSVNIQCRLGMYGATSSGTIWLDDLSLKVLQ